MAKIEDIIAAARVALIPPAKVRLSEWIEANVNLPSDVTAEPGRVRLIPYQREIADCIGSPDYERVTIVKPVRVGFTTLLTSAVASFIVNDPAPILCLLPTESACRDYMVSDIEPIFQATAAVSKALSDDLIANDRNTILARRFPGGSLKVVAAKSPSNLRRLNVRVLFIDEADGMEVTKEGSPILLAEKRTLQFSTRKIVIGSTPVHSETSHVLRAYSTSDQRVFEVPCPECGAFTEIMWQHIIWDDGDVSSARFKCPHCHGEIDESHKPQMVLNGVWRATRPEVVGHAGFRINALVSPLINAAWPKLAQEFVQAKNDATTLQTFVNTILGQGWRGAGEELDEGDLAKRAEAEIGIEPVPAPVLVMTLGVDVQHDRLEATLLGFDEQGATYVLQHFVLWGAWDDDGVWSDLDELLGRRFPHALGGTIGIDAAAIDAGDGTTMRKVLAFGTGRRKVYPIKGADGNRPHLERAQKIDKSGTKLFIVGVDTLKTLIFGRARSEGQMRFSGALPDVWFEQFTSERAVIRYVKGQPKRIYERLPARRAEALDCVVYAMAVRGTVNPDWGVRRLNAAEIEPVKKAAKKPQGDSWINVQGDWL